MDVRTGNGTESYKHAILVWEKYQEQLAERNGVEMEADEYLEKRALFAVGEHQPYFLAKSIH